MHKHSDWGVTGISWDATQLFCGPQCAVLTLAVLSMTLDSRQMLASWENPLPPLPLPPPPPPPVTALWRSYSCTLMLAWKLVRSHSNMGATRCAALLRGFRTTSTCRLPGAPPGSAPECPEHMSRCIELSHMLMGAQTTAVTHVGC